VAPRSRPRRLRTEPGDDPPGRPGHDPPHWFRQGHGEPVVVLPGLSFSHEAPSGATRLFESALVLGLSRRVEVHWLGRRPGVPEGHSLADFATDCAEAIRARFDRAAPVVGFSTGGLLGLQLVLDHPEVVDRLVVVGAGARLSDSARASDRAWISALEQGRTADAWAALAADLTDDAAATRALARVLGVVGPWVTPRDCTDGIRTARAEVDVDLTARLHEVNVRTLLVVGGRDPNVGVDLATRTRAAIPGGQLLVLPGVGHLGSMVHPRTTDRINRFLAAGGTSGG
jgi:pimeloyl-ACP methyl ester carboxylesterase